jgi:hypothetical protein
MNSKAETKVRFQRKHIAKGVSRQLLFTFRCIARLRKTLPEHVMKQERERIFISKQYVLKTDERFAPFVAKLIWTNISCSIVSKKEHRLIIFGTNCTTLNKLTI